MLLNNYAVDLHIHSTLSPCADLEMTPNNIVNMCRLKKLDIIAVTDHNSTANLPAIHRLCKQHGILLLPGIEVNTKEEVHLLCYFEDLLMAMKFGEIIYNHLPMINNDEKIFGSQLVLDENDCVIAQISKLLISSTDISIDEMVEIARQYKGKVVPAHVDRSSYSIINNLGFIPNNLNFNTLEFSNVENFELYSKVITNEYKIMKSSDAHYLHQILERNQFFELMNLDTISLLRCL
ncbi:PHP domain-containing protein [Alkalibaculum sp. M08DMB]|uniref:PHP domain-containing protein n=1 Tax=Alkalibaculum sporogenes TaxID=2655001 RepID=A0A6A7K5W9_9FIRM|nr:PHP domain-containing protein [Alkalibaculum sporogenes]MPW24828.1 PHP domain-containing protein [Alkalibaculum sporogenes]